MTQNKVIIWSIAAVLVFGLFSCIKQYNPDIQSSDTQKIVVSGQLTDVEGWQTVHVSLTSSIDNPKQIPLKNCQVKLISNSTQQWNYSEIKDGDYQLWLNNNEVLISDSFYIQVITPDGQRIESQAETFSKSSPIGLIHYSEDGYFNNINNQRYDGLQFYMDLSAKKDDSRFYYFQVVETFEFHTKGPIEWWYDGVVHHEVPLDYSKTLCWNTEKIDDIFVLSTENLNKNEYKDLKLNFTNNHSQRLAHLYSINLIQYAISKPAYRYWKQMRDNMHQTGGLYNNQPYPIRGNLINKTNPDKGVLGYFMVTTVKEKRIFVQPQGFDIIDNSCDTAILRMGLIEISPFQYPVYLDGNSQTYFNSVLAKPCVNCEAQGGSTTKPSYWP